MATQVISGAGELTLRDNTNNLFYPGGFAAVELSTDVDIQKARRLNAQGNLIISDSYAGLSESEIKITMEVADSLSLGHALNSEKPAIVSSAQYYDYVEATVPSTTPYEIPLLGVTTALANSGSVLVTMFQSGAWNSISSGQKSLALNRVTGTPTDGDFKIDTTTAGSEKLVFNAAQAGAPVVISYLKTVSSKLSVGLAPNPVISGSLYFSAKLISDEFPNGAIMILPSITKTSGFSYKTGDVPTVENTYQIGTPAGYRIPINMLFL